MHNQLSTDRDNMAPRGKYLSSAKTVSSRTLTRWPMRQPGSCVALPSISGLLPACGQTLRASQSARICYDLAVLAGTPAPDPGPRQLRPCVITPRAHRAPPFPDPPGNTPDPVPGRTLGALRTRERARRVPDEVVD
jgi:hypothetical protein